VLFIAVALLASANDPLSRMALSAISEVELPITRVVDVRSSVENHVENLLINFDKEWHAHSYLAPNYRFREGHIRTCFRVSGEIRQDSL